MIYYVNGKDLYASETVITAPAFAEITEAEYNDRLKAAVNNRHKGEPVLNPDEWR